PLCGIGKHWEMINPSKRAAYLDPGRDREEVQDSYPKTCTRMGNACVTILGRRSLKLHATEISLSRSKRKEKNQCCTTLAAIHAGYVTKIRMRILKKIQGGKKKSRVC